VRTRPYTWCVANQIDKTMQPELLVAGCSEQLPDRLRAYHVVADEVSSYHELIERMLCKVLDNLPASVRSSARTRLVKRWNRDWGVNAEDLEGQRNGSCQANAAVAAN
jgi:hypothetical protein